MVQRIKALGLPKNKCTNCGHTWVSRIENPKMCPKCHSIKIERSTKRAYKKKCAKCQYEWVPRIDDPKLCPGCGTPYWRGPERDENGNIVRGQHG